MNFLFDIGNVLLNLHFERFHAAVLGSSDALLPQELVRLKDPYEAGEIDDREFVSRCLAGLASPLTPARFTAAWQDVFSANEPMWEVVRQLKTGDHRLILFSNTNGLHSTYFLQQYSVFRYFDHHHFSHEAGVMKPQRNFYQQAIARYQLDPAQTLYIDDLPDNIATGREFGFACWRYAASEHPACLQWLAEQGIAEIGSAGVRH